MNDLGFSPWDLLILQGLKPDPRRSRVDTTKARALTQPRTIHQLSPNKFEPPSPGTVATREPIPHLPHSCSSCTLNLFAFVCNYFPSRAPGAVSSVG